MLGLGDRSVQHHRYAFAAIRAAEEVLHVARIRLATLDGGRLLAAIFSLNLVLLFRIFHSLPLHIGGIIRTTARQRYDMVYNVAWAASNALAC